MGDGRWGKGEGGKWKGGKGKGERKAGWTLPTIWVSGIIHLINICLDLLRSSNEIGQISILLEEASMTARG